MSDRRTPNPRLIGDIETPDKARVGRNPELVDTAELLVGMGVSFRRTTPGRLVITLPKYWVAERRGDRIVIFEGLVRRIEVFPDYLLIDNASYPPGFTETSPS